MEAKIDSNHRDVLLLGYEDEENLGLRYIAAYLVENGVSVGIIPLQNLDLNELPELILQINPKIIGFSMIFQRMLPNFSEIINSLRANGIKCHITMGGHFPTMEYEKTLELIPGLDSIVRHEGELTLLELVKCVNAPNQWLQIKGLAFRMDGFIQKAVPRPLIQNLDDLPFPLRSGKIRNHRGLGISSIISSRGCQHNCSFCSVQEFYGGAPGPKRRTRSPENVVREMRILFESGTRIFIFKDDDFSMVGLSHQQWIKRFVKNLEDAHMANKILWRISSRIDGIDADMLELLASTGLRFIYLGIESGNNQGLTTCNKHFTVDDIIAKVNILKYSKINFEYGFMMLDPYSNMASIKDNIAFLRYLCYDASTIVHFTKMVPYAGTSIYRRLEEEGRLKGSIAAPDYSYIDPKVDALETFIVRAFYHMLFHPDGIVSKLQYAKFDAIVSAIFLNNEINAERYISEVQKSIKSCNNSTLNALEQAVEFMECRSPGEIYADWPELGKLADKTRTIQSTISLSLNNLIPDKSIIFRKRSGI